MRRLPFTLLLALAACALPQRADGVVPPVDRTAAPAADTARLHITGTATVRLPADRARVVFAVLTEGATASEASAENAELAEAVLAALRPRIGPDDRIETQGYRVQPRYRSGSRTDEGLPEIRSYMVSNSVVVVTEDVDGVGPMLDAALDAGANRVDQLVFFAEPTPEQREEAIARATECARREAEATAAALGMRLGPVVEVRTQVGGGAAPRFGGAIELQAARADTPIEAGSDQITASVSVVWTLLDPTR